MSSVTLSLQELCSYSSPQNFLILPILMGIRCHFPPFYLRFCKSNMNSFEALEKRCTSLTSLPWHGDALAKLLSPSLFYTFSCHWDSELLPASSILGPILKHKTTSLVDCLVFSLFASDFLEILSERPHSHWKVQGRVTMSLVITILMMMILVKINIAINGIPGSVLRSLYASAHSTLTSEIGSQKHRELK